MQRYFIDDDNSKVDLEYSKIIIMSEDVHHIKNVMRMKPTDQVVVCYQKKSFLCTIESLSNTEVSLNIVEQLEENSELLCKVTIAQGLVCKEKMEEVIDHITELGASFYLPVLMERSKIKLVAEKLNNKMIRLNKIAKEAAEQSHRTSKLDVLEPMKFKEFIKFSQGFDLCLVAHVDSETTPYIGDLVKKGNSMLILVGPEGGITPDEIKALKDANFIQVNLGKRVLRTEVAPSYIMSIIDMVRGNNNEI